MLTSVPDIGPALFRTGDIGVAAEWRDLSYDWTPLLTPVGVSMYEQCRDTYDQQRVLFPFLLSPQGPTKQAMQRRLGLRTGFALEGPEYLLATVGLLHVEVGSYGPSADPERPNHTRVAYYAVGRLDHPTLDWPMLDRLLSSVHLALAPGGTDDSAARQQKKAMAALRSLGQAGFLQLCDPEDLFYPLGAWPYLLPTLIADPRWEALFTHLHGAVAMQRYRQQGRAWVEYAQRIAERLRIENDAIRDQVLAAQRRGPRGGTPSSSSTPAIPSTSYPSNSSSMLATGRSNPAGVNTVPLVFANSRATHPQISATHAETMLEQAGPVNETGCVAEMSLTSRYPGAVSETGLATHDQYPQQQAVVPVAEDVASESLRDDQLTSPCCCKGIDQFPILATQHALATSDIEGDYLPPIAPHLHDAELATTRYDGTFWCAINAILYGTHQRYPHTPGEKKAVERRFKRQAIPVGVVLAALRAMMTLPENQRPRRFGDAITSEMFQACIQQALALLPNHGRFQQDTENWPAFLQAYRSIGMSNELRNVSTTDYHVLYGLFRTQPDACWEILNRVEHASTVPNLSPAYVRRAILNNQQAALRQTMEHTVPAPTCGPGASIPKAPNRPLPRIIEPVADDQRGLLLDQAGLSRKLLQPWMTVEYIQAWLDEATARPNIENVQGWLIWGLGEQCWPHEHPKLPPRPSISRRQQRVSELSDTSDNMGSRLGAQAPDQGQREVDSDHAQIWALVLNDLQSQLPGNEFTTWIAESQLLELNEDQAIVGVPNIFAREKVEGCYRDMLCESLSGAMSFPIDVQVVIGVSCR